MCQNRAVTDNDFQPERLNQLGRRRAKLRADLEVVNAELDAEILRAAAAGVLQADIVRRTGLTRESVAQKMKPADERWRRGASATS